MAGIQLPLLTSFEFDECYGNVAGRWEKWLDRLVMYLTASGITDIAQKKATLLYCGGERLGEIHSSLPVLPKLEDEDDFQLVVLMRNGYFNPKKNVVFERHIFLTETMHVSVSIGTYILRLRKLAKTCQVEQYDSEQAIRDQVVRNYKDKSLQTRFLKEENLTLNSLPQFAAAHKQAKTHASELDKESHSFQCSSINSIQATHGDVNVRQTVTDGS